MSIVYHYDEQALNLLATIFKPGFIHLGASDWVAAINQEFALGNKRVLDFGCGAGGPACYLAMQSDVQVTGLDLSALLVEKSKALAEELTLQNRVEFAQITQLPLPTHHKFDLVMSINTISRVKEKDNLFSEFHRTLRTSGTLAIMDWFHKSSHYSDASKAFFSFTDDIFYLNTAQDYLQSLEKNKFSYVNFKDTTKNMRLLCATLIEQMKIEHQGALVARFGAEYYEWWLEYWQLLYAALQSGDLISGNVRAIKA
jgi:cyclopropane fatty-acyl-phospholipid synthase-like methyltransferase